MATETPAPVETPATTLTAVDESAPPAPVAPAAPAETAPVEAKDAAPAEPVEPAAPVEYVIPLPEGIKADDPLVAKFQPLAKELGIPVEQAGKLVDFYAKTQAELVKAQEAETEKRISGWLEQAKSDKEFGGTGFEAAGKLARRAIVAYATPELRELLADTGLGNHPELIRVFHRIGKAMAEDSVSDIRPASGAPSKPLSTTDEAFLRRQYPTHFSKE
jgi:hypothetical protein